MEYLLLISFVVALVSLTVSGEADFPNLRVTNAPRASVSQFPWHVSLTVQYRNDNLNRKTYCGGVILNELWILAAADCIFNARTIQADVGSVQLSRPAVTVFPDSYVVHPQYNPNRFRNNVALLRLQRPFNFPQGLSPNYRPVRLPRLSQRDVTFENQNTYFTGFGYTSFNSRNVSEFLTYSEQRVISNRVCLGYFQNDNQLISPAVLCAEGLDSRQAPCNGDGGGPLVINEFGTWTLIGTLSFLHAQGSCGRQVAPAAFTRITSHFDWIRQTTGYNFRP